MIAPVPLPDDALLRRYEQQPGAYTDCFSADTPDTVPFERFVAAFYTTPLFKLERLVLRLALRRPSTDAEAADLAANKRESFAAWTVEARRANQLLMRDLAGATRSWFMVEPLPDGTSTRVFFGSAVVPRSGEAKLGWPFHLLLGFHKLYSRALLATALRRLRRG